MTITVADFLKEVYQKYKAKQSKVPAAGTDKFLSVIVATNAKIREWATDPYHEWESLWQDVIAGIVTAGVQDYDLDDTIQRPSDKIIVTKNGQETKISLIKLWQRHLPQYQTIQYAYIHGNDPAQVTINSPINATTSYVGGAMTVPAYILPDAVNNPTDTIIIDSIDWLVHEVAADLARNDPAKRAQFPILQGQANEFWLKMVAAGAMTPASNPDEVEADMPNMGGW